MQYLFLQWIVELIVIGFTGYLFAFLHTIGQPPHKAQTAAPQQQTKTKSQTPPFFTVNHNKPAGFKSASYQLKLATVFYTNARIGSALLTVKKNGFSFTEPNKIYKTMTSQHLPVDDAMLEAFLREYHSIQHKNKPLKGKNYTYLYDKKHNILSFSPKKSTFKNNRKIITPRFLGHSSAELSNMSLVNFIGSGSVQSLNSRENFAFSNENILSYENNHLTSNFILNKNADNHTQAQITELYGETDFQSKQLLYGFLNNNGNLFSPSQTYVGLSVGSNMRMITNTEQLTTTPLSIFVPTQSQVNIFAENKLVFTSILQAGYHNIDTRQFPDGAYQLKIEINNTTSYQYYYKSSQLPPKNMLKYHATIGFLTNTINNANTNALIPVVTDIPFTNLGLNKRIRKNIALYCNFITDLKNGYLNVGSIFLIPHMITDISGILSADNQQGIKISLNANFKHLFGSLTGSYLTAPRKKDLSAQKSLISPIQSLLNGSIGYFINPKNNLNAILQYNEPFNQITSYSYGILYNHIIHLQNAQQMTISFSFNHSSTQGNTYLASAAFTFSNHHLSGSEAINVTYTGAKTSTQATNSNDYANIQGIINFNHQNDIGLGSSATLSHYFSSKQQSIGGNYTYTSRLLHTNIYANLENRNSAVTLNYGAQLNTEIISAANNNTLNGRFLNKNAGAFIVAQASDQSYQHLDFILKNKNNRPLDYIHPNRIYYVPLEPYHSYQLHLENNSDSAVTMTKNTHSYNLYPGNVIYLKWLISTKIIIIGQLVNLFDKKLPYAQLSTSNKNVTFTDASGFFQIAVPESTKTVSVKKMGGATCHIHLPNLNTNHSYLYLKRVLCG